MKKIVFCLLAAWCLNAVAQELTTPMLDRAEVLLETTEGNIRIALCNETPKHRDNFLKLVRMHVYDSLLFHRVVKDFMIQGGDLNSKHAKPGQLLGTGDLDYTIEPEFRLPQLYHKRGMLAAAREGDQVNPEMRSGACQFYIVWGKKFTDQMIGRVQEKLKERTHGRVLLTPEMIETYKTVGGTPHLDGQYTVFGEVLEGLDVVDRIQQKPVDSNHRTLTDVRILKANIKQEPFVKKEEPKQETKKRRR